MNEKNILILSFLIAAATILVAGLPSQGIVVPVDELVSSQFKLPVNGQISGAAVSGEWDGKGSAKVWLEGDNGRILVLNTADLRKPDFDDYCDNSCTVENLKVNNLVVESSGANIYIKNLELVVPAAPQSWASCPGCKKVALSGLPNHNILAITVMILLLIVSAHVMRSVCKNNVCKRGSLSVFMSGAGVLLALFSVSFVSPEGAFGAFVQYTTSILAAVGVIALFAFGAVELVSRGGEWHEKQK